MFKLLIIAALVVVFNDIVAAGILFIAALLAKLADIISLIPNII